MILWLFVSAVLVYFLFVTADKQDRFLVKSVALCWFGGSAILFLLDLAGV